MKFFLMLAALALVGAGTALAERPAAEATEGYDFSSGNVQLTPPVERPRGQPKKIQDIAAEQAELKDERDLHVEISERDPMKRGLQSNLRYQVGPEGKITRADEVSLQREISHLDEGARYAYLQEELRKYPNYWREAAIYYELARMHEGIGDMREALEHAAKARQVDPNNEVIERYHNRLVKVVDPKPTIGQKIRAFNAAHGLRVEQSYGYEHDTNVIQEEISPANATNKKDDSVKFSLSLTKGWKSSHKNLNQETYYALSDQNYFDHHELNLLINSLEHRLIWDEADGANTMSVIYKLGANHILNKDNALLWNWVTGPNIYYYMNSWDTLLNADLTYTRTAYFSKASNDQEGDNGSLSLSGTKYIDRRKLHSVKLGGIEIYEHTKGDTSQYTETVFLTQYERTWRDSSLTSISPYFEYKLRYYQHATAGIPEREDNQWNIGLDVKMSFIEHHRCQLSLNTLENDSNISSSHYRESKVTFLYGISL